MKAPAFDIPAMAAEMIGAARTALSGHAAGMKNVGEMELRRLAGALAEIGSLVAKGEIDEARAQQLIQIHRFTVYSVLRSGEGLGLLAVNEAMDAVMGVAGAVLQRVTGFRLLLPTTEASDSSTPEFKAGKDL